MSKMVLEYVKAGPNDQVPSWLATLSKKMSLVPDLNRVNR